MNSIRMTSGVAVLSLCALTAAASPILVSNFSFEDTTGINITNSCGTGCTYSIGAIPGWSGTNTTTGEFRPGTLYFNSIPNGTTVAYSDGATPLSQTVGAVVGQGVTYTLTVDLGARSDVNFAPFKAAADLLIGGVGGTKVVAGGTIPSPGNWSVFTATYVGLSGDVGKSITIELTSSGVGRQADFDNVALDALTPAPEPSGVTLLGLGLAGLWVFARRKTGQSLV